MIIAAFWARYTLAAKVAAIEKDASFEQNLEAIRTVALGQKYLLVTKKIQNSEKLEIENG